MQNRSSVKICLLGSGDKFSKFIYDLKNDKSTTSPETIGLDFFRYQCGDISYQIWDLRGQERFTSCLPPYLKDAVAIICFDVNDTLLNKCKTMAPDACQFITYDPSTMTPQACIGGIQLKPNMDLVKEANTKCQLLLEGAHNQGSAFDNNGFPIEITQKIGANYIQAAFKQDFVSFSFFKSPTNINSPETLEKNNDKPQDKSERCIIC